MDVNSLSFYLSWLVNFSSATEMLNEFAYGCYPILKGYYIIIGMFTCISLKMKKHECRKHLTLEYIIDESIDFYCYKLGKLWVIWKQGTEPPILFSFSEGTHRCISVSDHFSCLFILL